MKNYDEILRELSPVEEKDTGRWDVYGVNTYCPSVKVTNWWYYREGFPKDYDAFHPPGNMSRSSYVRLGTCEEGEGHWTTETADSMATGLGDERLSELIKQSRPRPMLTFLSYPRTQFVNGVALVATNPSHLREMLGQFQAVSAEAGLQINLSKTRVMYNDMIDSREDIKLGNVTMEAVEDYVYLGELIHGTSSRTRGKVRKDLLGDEIRLLLPSLPRDVMKMRYSTTYASSYKGMRAAPRT